MVLSSYSIKSSFKKKNTDAWTSLAESLTQADGQYSHIVAILNKLLQRILRKAKHEAPRPPHPGPLQWATNASPWANVSS